MEAKKSKAQPLPGPPPPPPFAAWLTLHAVTSSPTHARSDEAGIAHSRAAGETFVSTVVCSRPASAAALLVEGVDVSILMSRHR